MFGGIGKGAGLNTTAGESLNLVAGTVAAGAAAQGSKSPLPHLLKPPSLNAQPNLPLLYFTLADMTGDLKTGYLLRAKPKNQFVAQLVGAIVAVFLTTGLFVLFTTAAPCILYPPATGECALYFVLFLFC